MDDEYISVSDNRQQSSFVGMLVGTTKDAFPVADPVQICTETQRTAHLCADSLLLKPRDMPMSSASLTMAHDTIIAISRSLGAELKAVHHAVLANNTSTIPKPLADMAESLVTLVETVADCIFQIATKSRSSTPATPSTVDAYVLSRARLAISLCIEHIEESALTKDRMLAVLSVMATHLEAIKETVAYGVGQTKDKTVSLQLRATNRALSGSTAAFVAAAKAYTEKPSSTTQRHAMQFSKPLIALVDAVITYAVSEDLIAGTPPKPGDVAAKYLKKIEASTLSLVSAVTLFLKVLKITLTQSISSEYIEQLTKYLSAANIHLVEISDSVSDAIGADLVTVS